MSTVSTVRFDATGDSMLPIWRGAQVFRFASVFYAVGAQVVSVSAQAPPGSGKPAYEHPLVSWLLIALLVVWSGASGLVYAFHLTRRRPVVIAEVVITAALIVSTMWVVRPEYYHHHQSLPSTFWITNAVVSVALLWGPVVGGLTGVGFSLLSLGIEQQFHNLLTDATTPILLTVGVSLGIGGRIVRRAQQQLAAAVRIRAATEERDRLAREVHDGVLQVLALVRRRGSEIGGPAEQLAQLAGEQEQALRILLSEQNVFSGDDPTQDLRQRLQAVLPAGVAFSGPAEAVPLPDAHIVELVAAVRTALDNVQRHAGPDAQVFILLEDLGTEVVLTVRDDGVGIPAGRVEEASREGRLGISKSIRGRLESIGGTALLDTEPDLGTEWELHVPRV